MKTMSRLLRPTLHAALLIRVVLILCALDSSIQARDAAPASVTVFTNVLIFDGKSGQLSLPSNVLVRGNTIEKISTDPIPVDRLENPTLINGNGHTLMPGLIDAHWHSIMAATPLNVLMTADIGYLNLLAGAEAGKTLMRGFTTVRDCGGPAFGLKRAIDEGVVNGPRIYPSGAMITTTGGHGDFRQIWELPRVIGGPLTHIEQLGATMIADSPDEVRTRVREQLMQGASQIKLMAGGGVASPHSPLDVSTFNESELHAAVEAAENWGTYVTVHAYTPAAIQRSIAAGVKCIEHGHLMDDATAQMMAQSNIWLSTQPFTEDEGSNPFPPGTQQHAKKTQVVAATDNVYALAKKYNLKTAWGSDILFDAAQTASQGAVLTRMIRWYTPAEALRMATSANGELLALSGPRNPYPGKLGVVEEGALADLLLVNGDPIADIKLIEDPDKNFLVIMKDGKIYKNITR